MRVHVLVDAGHQVLAYVPTTDSWPRPVLAPLDHAHTVYENVEVSDALAQVRGAEAFAMVHAHLLRHLELLRGGG